VTLAAAGVLSIAAASAVAGPGDVGYEGPSYAGGALEITGEKPESKLWWNDGHWWASMFDDGTSDFHIFRLNVATQTWIDTGVAIDPRAKSKADALWDQANQKLYVASHVFSKSGNTTEPSRLWRYSYNAATDTYTVDAGFPVTIAAFSGETLVIDKDSTGQLWATWKQGTQIMVNRSTCPATGPCPLTADATWGTPFVPSVDQTNAGSTTVNADDISSLIAFSGKIGLMWSNQAKKAFFFAVHDDSAADTTWQASKKIAVGTSAFADDHVNMKLHAADGRIFVAAKTSLGSTQARIVVLVRDTAGNWTIHQHSTGSDDMTRPILMVDEANNRIHVFATEEGGGSLYVKSSPMTSVAFGAGKGKPVIVDFDNPEIENPTSAKRSVNATTGMVVLASNDLTKRYWHHYDSLTGGGPPPPPPSNTLPVATNDAYTMSQGAVLNVAAPGVLANDADADTDPLTATKTSNPANGTVTFSSNGSFSYTPNPTFTGVDSFKYVASDGTGDSNQATVTITVNPAGGGGAVQTFTPSNDAYVRSAYPTENNGAATTLRTYTASGKETRSYLMFTVSGLSGSVTSAKLRLFVKDASPSGGALHRVADNSWSESTLTWGTPAPALGTLITNVGQATLNTWVEINVAGFVTGNGTWSFAIAGISNDVAYYSSKEGTSPPQLVVTS
jgi:hypothetical protein